MKLTWWPIKQKSEYVYKKLPPGDYIRLLELEPGQGDDVSVSLRVVNLKKCPPYVAISYVWGPVTDAAIISCDGKILAVQENLYQALRALRDKSNTRLLWADAICINQESNVSEKNHQVAQMGKIFGQPLSAFSLATEIASHKYPLLIRKQDILPAREACDDVDWVKLVHFVKPSTMDNMSTAEVMRWENLSAILRRPNFQRVWVCQEIGLASRATVLCGSSTVPWAMLADAANIVMVKAHAWAEQLDMLQHAQDCHYMHHIFLSYGLEDSFVQTLERARYFQASVSLDYVYALLSHPSARTSRGTLLIEPDYSSSIESMSTELAFSILRETASLEILSTVEREDAAAVSHGSLPSFVPEWCSRSKATSLWWPHKLKRPSIRAALDEPADFQASELTRELVVAGIMVDTICAVGSKIHANLWRGSRSERRMPLRALAGLMESEIDAIISRYPSKNRQFRAFCDTISCGKFRGPIDEVVQYAADCNFQATFFPQQSDRTQASHTDNPQRSSFLSKAVAHTHTRRPFVSTGGYIGFGSRAMQSGDILCVLFGCPVPFILRKSSAGSYRLVEECYAHGIMQGEAMGAWQTGLLKKENFVLH